MTQESGLFDEREEAGRLGGVGAPGMRRWSSWRARVRPVWRPGRRHGRVRGRKEPPRRAGSSAMRIARYVRLSCIRSESGLPAVPGGCAARCQIRIVRGRAESLPAWYPRKTSSMPDKPTGAATSKRSPASSAPFPTPGSTAPPSNASWASAAAAPSKSSNPASGNRPAQWRRRPRRVDRASGRASPPESPSTTNADDAQQFANVLSQPRSGLERAAANARRGAVARSSTRNWPTCRQASACAPERLRFASRPPSRRSKSCSPSPWPPAMTSTGLKGSFVLPEGQ